MVRVLPAVALAIGLVACSSETPTVSPSPGVTYTLVTPAPSPTSDRQMFRLAHRIMGDLCDEDASGFDLRTPKGGLEMRNVECPEGAETYSVEVLFGNPLP